MASSLFGSQYKVLLDLHGDLFDVIFFCGVFVEIRWIVGLWSRLSMNNIWIFSEFFYVWLVYLCKSLWIIGLVWPTRLIFLAMGEVLSFGFNLVVLDPSDRKGTDTYCIVATKDNNMGFISYCMSLSLYIMSSCLKRYSDRKSTRLNSSHAT